MVVALSARIVTLQTGFTDAEPAGEMVSGTGEV